MLMPSFPKNVLLCSFRLPTAFTHALVSPPHESLSHPRIAASYSCEAQSPTRLSGTEWLGAITLTIGKQEQFASFKEAPEQTFPPFSDEDSRCLIRTMALQGGSEYYSKFGNDESLEAAIAKTLCMDRTWRGERTCTDSSFVESFAAFQKLYGEGPGETLPEDKKVHWSGIFAWIWDFDEQEESQLRKKSWPFEVAFQEAHKGRRFCATREGYLCTAPYNADRGDRTVVFEGFKVPFVLRREENDWKFVGDCYVHGIMDGELLVPVQDREASPDEVFMDADCKRFGLQTLTGFAKFQDFSII